MLAILSNKPNREHIAIEYIAIFQVTASVIPQWSLRKWEIFYWVIVSDTPFLLCTFMSWIHGKFEENASSLVIVLIRNMRRALLQERHLVRRKETSSILRVQLKFFEQLLIFLGSNTRESWRFGVIEVGNCVAVAQSNSK